MSVRVTVVETGTHWKHSVARPRQLYAGPPLAAGRTSLVPCSYPFETHFANEDGWIGWMLLSPVAPVRYTLAYTEEDETWSLVLSHEQEQGRLDVIAAHIAFAC